MNEASAKARRDYPLQTPTSLSSEATQDLAPALTALLADFFALYLKTKNFHWHMSGPHFRDYHLLLDDHGDQIFAATDAIAERVRKIGGTTLRSIGQISALQRLPDNDADFVTPLDMLSELREDNMSLVGYLRETPRALRRAWRCRNGEPDRGLDRRGRDAGPGSSMRRAGAATGPDTERDLPRPADRIADEGCRGHHCLADRQRGQCFYVRGSARGARRPASGRRASSRPSRRLPQRAAPRYRKSPLRLAPGTVRPNPRARICGRRFGELSGRPGPP